MSCLYINDLNSLTLNLQSGRHATNLHFSYLEELDRYIVQLSQHGGDVLASVNNKITTIIDRKYTKAARAFFEKAIEMIDRIEEKKKNE